MNNIKYRKIGSEELDLSQPQNEIEDQGLGVVSVKFNHLGTRKHI